MELVRYSEGWGLGAKSLAAKTLQTDKHTEQAVMADAFLTLKVLLPLVSVANQPWWLGSLVRYSLSTWIPLAINGSNPAWACIR